MGLLGHVQRYRGNRSQKSTQAYLSFLVAVRLYSSPRLRQVSHEGPYDVAKTDEVRAALDAWDPEVTVRLCEERKQQMRARAEARLTTAAERDNLARSIIRDELIEKATAGDARGLKEQLIELADDANQTGQRPRGTCEVRDARGMTLLSLSAQHGRLEVMELLLRHWKTCDDGKVGITPGTDSWERRVLKANPNSRCV